MSLRPPLLIPARAGSKRIRGKNLRPLSGKPLLVWSVEAALGSGVGPVVVSTESEEIARVAREAGANVLRRPRALARDNVPGHAVVRHAAGQLTGPAIILLQPTSPLRTPDDIRAAYRAFRKSHAQLLLSVARLPPPGWYLKERRSGSSMRLDPASRGESASAARTKGSRPRATYWVPNGAIYIYDRSAALAPDPPRVGLVGFPMPSWRSIDIDTEEDWLHAELLVHALGQRYP